MLQAILFLTYVNLSVAVWENSDGAHRGEQRKDQDIKIIQSFSVRDAVLK